MKTVTNVPQPGIYVIDEQLLFGTHEKVLISQDECYLMSYLLKTERMYLKGFTPATRVFTFSRLDLDFCF